MLDFKDSNLNQTKIFPKKKNIFSWTVLEVKLLFLQVSISYWHFLTR